MNQLSFFNSHENQSASHSYEAFCGDPPYTKPPFSKKTWGHPLHSLCSYQGKLKPAQAHWLVRCFTSPGDVVLDPLGGVGTIAFEACLQGRIGISSDLSPLASTIAHAKICPPTFAEASARLPTFWKEVESTQISDVDHEDATFGLNSPVSHYYHPDTLVEVLKARRFFLNRPHLDNVETFFRACCLHILHGNRPYAVSRTSHPITPFSPSGPFVYKSVREKILERFTRVLAAPLPDDFTAGVSVHADYQAIPETLSNPVDAIITSPPFVGMRFDRPNWLRMWFCGWGARDFAETSLQFLDRQQTKTPEIYTRFFEICADVARKHALMIVHVGKSKNYNMIENLLSCAEQCFALEWIGEEDVRHLQKHGIGDKGQTTENCLLFLRRR